MQLRLTAPLLWSSHSFFSSSFCSSHRPSPSSSTKASALSTWTGDLQHGQGFVRSESGLVDASFTKRSRFGGDMTGLNPEELIASAHSSSYAMSLAHVLAKAGLKADALSASTVITLNRKAAGDWDIDQVDLYVKGTVPSSDRAHFARLLYEAELSCPVSRALRVRVRIHAALQNAESARHHPSTDSM